MTRTFTLGQILNVGGNAVTYMGKARDGSYALVQNAQGETKRVAWDSIK